MGSSSVEEAVQKRIEMFKSSQTNIKKLSKSIRSGDISASVDLVDFHVKWSEEMLHLFPAGSEASTSNRSDASSDIWRDPTGFKERVDQYNLSAKELREALKSKNISLINENFERMRIEDLLKTKESRFLFFFFLYFEPSFPSPLFFCFFCFFSV